MVLRCELELSPYNPQYAYEYRKYYPTSTFIRLKRPFLVSRNNHTLIPAASEMCKFSVHMNRTWFSGRMFHMYSVVQYPWNRLYSCYHHIQYSLWAPNSTRKSDQFARHNNILQGKCLLLQDQSLDYIPCAC